MTQERRRQEEEAQEEQRRREEEAREKQRRQEEEVSRFGSNPSWEYISNI